MNLRLVGATYRLPRITGMYYRLPRICDMSLLSQFQIIRIVDSVSVQDEVKFEQAVSIKDHALVWSECLIANPPMEDTVDVSDIMQSYTRFSRTFGEDHPAIDNTFIGFDKSLYDTVSVGDRVSIHLDKQLYDYTTESGTARGYIDFEQLMTDGVTTDDSFLRFDYEKYLTDAPDVESRVGIDSSKDAFADAGGVGDEAAIGFDKKIVDDATLTDSLSVTLTRTTNSTYGQSVYGGATFGG